eukprot:1192575-Pyramimonas_sp.AAC.1
MPLIAVHVSMLHAVVNSATVKDLGRINQLVKTIHEFASTGVTMHPYKQMACVCWIVVFEGRWEQSRRLRDLRDRGTSKKLTRKGRSSLGAEIQAASEAAEEL